MIGDSATLTLDFTTGVLDPRLTFTRASTTATYINSSGYVTTAGTDVARFDHDPTTLAPRGLLVEAQATNVLTYSEQFNTAPWTAFSGSITANDGVAPDGNTTADSITPSVVNGGVYFSNSFAAGTWTFSVWAKANTGNTLTISIDNSSNGRAVAITLSTATAGTPFVRGTGGTVSSLTVNGVTVFQNSWVRISLTVVTTGANFVAMYNANDTNKILVWGAMLETGSGASSYISTGASQATRNADSCVMTGTNFSSWFAGATEGVLYTQFEKPRSQAGTIGHDHAAVGSQYGSGTGFTVYAAASVYYPTTLLWPTGGALFPGGIASAIPNVSKQAGKWFGGNDATNYANGVQGTTSAGTGTLAPNMLTIGANSASGTAATRDWLNACVRIVKFWPVALPDSQIIALTTP
jgi:hypothetical protein